MQTNLRKKILVSYPIILCTLLIYAYYPSITKLDYVWDDLQLFIFNPYLRDPELIWQGIFRPILEGTTYFRPLPLLTFCIEFLTQNNANPTVSHIVNLLIHLTNTALLCAILFVYSRKSNNKSIIIITGSIVYSLHPALVEPVAWAAGRFDLLVTTFSLAAVYSFLRYTGWTQAFLTSLFFFFALLCKEMAITLPIAIFLLKFSQDRDYFYYSVKKAFKSDGLPLWGSLTLSLAAYIAIRMHYMPEILHTDESLARKFYDIPHHISYVGWAFIFYFKMVFWPFSSLNPQHPLDPLDMTKLDVILGCLACVGLILLTIISLRFKARSLILLSCFAISLLPVSHILPLTIGGNIGHERFLAYPLVWFSIFLAQLIYSIFLWGDKKSKKVTTFTFATFIFSWTIYSSAVIKITTPLWQSDLSLWSWVLKVNPGLPYAALNYSIAAIREGDYESAEKMLEKNESIQYSPKDAIFVLLTKADLQIRKGNAKIGTKLLEEYLLQQGIKSASDYSIDEKSKDSSKMKGLYAILARGYIYQEEFSKAEMVSDMLILSDPHNASALLFSSYAKYGMDKWSEGEHLYKESTRYFVPAGVEEAAQSRSIFLSNLCKNPENSTPQVCSQFRVDNSVDLKRAYR